MVVLVISNELAIGMPILVVIRIEASSLVRSLKIHLL